jgi:hypothetical protein
MKFLSRLFLAGLCAVILLPVARAQVQPTYTGIPTIQFNYVAAAQQRDEWCWAASIQMIPESVRDTSKPTADRCSRVWSRASRLPGKRSND